MDIGGGGNAFQFDHVGDSVTGLIRTVTEVQQTDMDSGRPAFWDSGQPKMMFRVELATELRDFAGDDGKRTVHLRGSVKPESQSSLAAVVGALRQATGGTDLAAGGRLTLTFIGEGESKQRGYNRPKFYSATYVAPSANLGGGQNGSQGGDPWQAPPVQHSQNPNGYGQNGGYAQGGYGQGGYGQGGYGQNPPPQGMGAPYTPPQRPAYPGQAPQQYAPQGAPQGQPQSEQPPF